MHSFSQSKTQISFYIVSSYRLEDLTQRPACVCHSGGRSAQLAKIFIAFFFAFLSAAPAEVLHEGTAAPAEVLHEGMAAPAEVLHEGSKDSKCGFDPLPLTSFILLYR
jgi:hypothetical protein